MAQQSPERVGFASRLRQERHRLQLTQSAVAALGGVATTTQVAYEQGLRTPDADYLGAIGAADFDLPYLLLNRRQRRFASDHFDWELLSEIVEHVTGWCRERKVELDTRRRLKIARLIYDSVEKMDDIGRGAVDRVLTLVVTR